GQTIFLVGEPGAGKTRLAQEVTLTLRDRGFLVAAGSCYEAEQSVPYYPFLDALSVVYAAAHPSVRDLARKSWPYLAVLLPDQLGNPELATGEQDDQQRVLRAVAGFLEASAEMVPVALLLDDLHWADAASL